jgi:hypothetical protein
MRLEVKHVTALDSALPSVEIEKLLRWGREGLHEGAERSAGQAVGLHEESRDAWRGNLETEWVLKSASHCDARVLRWGDVVGEVYTTLHKTSRVWGVFNGENEVLGRDRGEWSSLQEGCAGFHSALS